MHQISRRLFMGSVAGAGAGLALPLVTIAEPRQEAVALVRDRRDELDALPLELGGRALDVVAHEEELMLPGRSSRVHRQLPRRPRRRDPHLHSNDL